MIARSLSKALTENLPRIQAELGAEEWPRFRRELAPLLKQFPRTVTDASALELAADPLWEVCRRYPSVKALALEYSQQQREVDAGGEGYASEVAIEETCNEYYALDAQFAESSDQGGEYGED